MRRDMRPKVPRHKRDVEGVGDGGACGPGGRQLHLLHSGGSVCGVRPGMGVGVWGLGFGGWGLGFGVRGLGFGV
jgi:hypothetical protein